MRACPRRSIPALRSAGPSWLAGAPRLGRHQRRQGEIRRRRSRIFRAATRCRRGTWRWRRSCRVATSGIQCRYGLRRSASSPPGKLRSFTSSASGEGPSLTATTVALSMTPTSRKPARACRSMGVSGLPDAVCSAKRDRRRIALAAGRFGRGVIGRIDDVAEDDEANQRAAEINEEIRASCRSAWLSFAAFGGSLVLVRAPALGALQYTDLVNIRNRQRLSRRVWRRGVALSCSTVRRQFQRPGRFRGD